MNACVVRFAGLAAALLLAAPALAQEPPEAAAPPAASGEAPSKPAPKPKRKPKSPKAEKADGAAKPEPRTGREADAPPAAQVAPTPSPPPAAPPRTAGAGPVVACEPGQAVLYDEPKGFSFWVTRSGRVTIDNPLRPLTPDVTQVLQLVIGDWLATAYGPDLLNLRRGASPGALEGALGGAIRWDPALASLPDNLDILSDAGQPLAQMRFKECGTAPVAKAAPVARKREEKPKGVRKTPAADQAVAPPPAADAPPPRRLNLPQGAIPE